MATISETSFVNCGLKQFVKGKSYFEMRSLSPILDLGFLNCRNGWLLRMDKMSDFLTFFGMESVEQFLLELRVITN